MKDPKVLVGNKNPTELHKAAVTGEPPGPVRLSITARWPDDVRDLRAIGRAIDAHALADFLMRAVMFAQQRGDKLIPIPVNVVGEIILVLSALPGPGRGRRRLPSTNDALDAVKEGASKRKAAGSVSADSRERDAIRSRLRGLKRYKPKSGKK
jgi:hypothetical protein